MIVFLLLIICLAFASSQVAVCPPGENIKPCTCSIGVDKKTWVSCESLKSVDVLRKAVTGMKGQKLSTFTLKNANIGVLPADIFNDLEIQVLNILFANITSLSESLNRPPLLGQENSLEYFEIRNTFEDEDTPLTRISLAHLKKLTVIQFEGNLIPTIGNDWFESGPFSLRELYLLDTSTDTLGSHAFFFLKNLRKLTFTGSRISEISREMFPQPAVFLEELDLSDNKIVTLPKDIFSKMPSLNKIVLQQNALTFISEISFAAVWSQMSYVAFYGNPLVCDDNMKWIYKYRLPESLQGHCVAPPRLRMKSLQNLKLADFEEH